jgi:hypothetical protein
MSHYPTALEQYKMDIPQPTGISKDIDSRDMEYYTNHLSESNDNYFNQNIYNYWISASHNTYLPYGQIVDPSNTCYYKLMLNLFFGGCVEIDTDSITRDNQDVVVTHLPTNSKSIKLSEILKIVVEAVKTKIAKGIRSGPIIVTFDNKKLTKKAQHQVFWNVLERELLSEENYQYVATITDDFDLTSIPISEISNKILLRWGENSSCDSSTPTTQKVGKDLCRPDGFSNPDYSFIKASNNWIHLKKGHVNLRTAIRDVSNNTVSVSVPLRIRLTPPNYNLIVNTQSNIMRIYPHFSYTMSQNYDNMIFFRDGVQITALNLQYMSDAWYLNSAVFMPAHGISCSPANTKKANSSSQKCYNGWDNEHLKYKMTRDEPLAYRLKPLWLTGLLPYPRLYNLKINVIELHKMTEKGKSPSNDIDEYPIFNVTYGLNKSSASVNNDGRPINIANVDPTVPFFVVEVVKAGSLGKGFSKALAKINAGSKYKGGIEIPWDANRLHGVIYTTVHKIRRTVSGNYNKVELDDNCENSNIFNSRKQMEVVLSYEWTPANEIPEVKSYNDAIVSLRKSSKYTAYTVADFLSNLELMNQYQDDLKSTLLGKPFAAPRLEEEFIDEDAEAEHYAEELEPLSKGVKATNVTDVTEE